MTRKAAKRMSHHKEVRAWAVRRRQVDIHQLALAYYLLARIRIERQRQEGSLPVDSPTDTPTTDDTNGAT